MVAIITQEEKDYLDSLDLPTNFRTKVSEQGFIKSFDELREEDFKLMDEIPDKVKGMYNRGNRFFDIVTGDGSSGSSYCCQIYDMIESGEVYYYYISDLSRPQHRVLYTDLVELFETV